MEKLVATAIPKRVKVQQKWTYQENITILQFLKNTIQRGQAIEKPTARVYYERLLRETKILKRDPRLLKNKVRNFATSYKKAVAWKNSRLYNCQEEYDESVIQAKLKKICPFFKELDDIWGSKANYEGSSLSMPLDSVISNEELVQAGETSDSYYDLENVVDVQILESDENDPLPLFGDTLGNVRTAKQREFHPGSSVEVMSPPNNDSSSFLSDGSKRSRQNSTENATTRTVYEEAILEREKYNKSKLEIERSRLDLERRRFEFDQHFQKQKLEFKRQKHLTEIAMREKELEVKKRELELQVLRWQVELVKQQFK